jgi:pimeloyl-ACP methyl ester carboxylesterase
MTTTASWTEERVTVAGAEMQILKGGSGDPLLVLHDEMGQPGWLQLHEELAKSHTVYAPSLPGFGVTSRLDWVMNMRDIATWTLWALDDLELSSINVVGFSLGGWLAAEMATQQPQIFEKMALVAPAGILPPTGEILDMFLIVSQEFITTGFHNPSAVAEFQAVCPDEPSPEQVEMWETAREEACRLSWRPYMHDRSLPHRLGRLKNLPSLIVWGRNDAVVPPSAGEVYNHSIAGSRLVTIENCGHRSDVEKSAELAAHLKEFFG